MKKLRLRKWVKYLLAELMLILAIFGVIRVLDARLRYACKYQGYTAICPIESDGE